MAPGQEDASTKPARRQRLGSLAGPTAPAARSGSKPTRTPGSGSGDGGGPPPAAAPSENAVTTGGVKKTRFAPKVPTRRAPKKPVKQEETEEDSKLDPALQALLKQSRENPTGAFNRRSAFGDSKGSASTVRVAFGFGSGAIGKAAFSTPSKLSFGEGGGGGGGGGTGAMKVKAEPHFEDPDGNFYPGKRGGKMKEFKDPLDYSRNYPTTLPLREPRAGPAELLDEAEFGEVAQKAEFEEAAVGPAEELALTEDSQEERLLFFQLPTSLPLGELSLDDAPARAQGGAHLAKLCDLPGGLMGKLKIYESGAVKLHLGAVVLEALPGAKCVFHQELVAINPTAKTCHFLGDVTQRVVLTPDMDNLLQEM